MDGIKNFLSLINDNWTCIIVVISLILSIYKKAKVYFSKSNDKKIEIAKEQIKERILKMITDAEIDFNEWNKAGSIKRSQVIGEIFEKYPILSKSINQYEIIKWIDNEINNSLNILREVISKNEE